MPSADLNGEEERLDQRERELNWIELRRIWWHENGSGIQAKWNNENKTGLRARETNRETTAFFSPLPRLFHLPSRPTTLHTAVGFQIDRKTSQPVVVVAAAVAVAESRLVFICCSWNSAGCCNENSTLVVVAAAVAVVVEATKAAHCRVISKVIITISALSTPTTSPAIIQHQFHISHLTGRASWASPGLRWLAGTSKSAPYIWF